MEEWEEGTGGEKKKDFFCQIQSGIHYPSRAAVGARFNLQAIFLESVCILSVCVVCCSAVSWGKPFIPQNNIPHTVSALGLSLLSCMLSISQMQKLTHTPSFTRLPSNFSYYTFFFFFTLTHILTFSLKDSTSCGIRP